MGNKFLVWGLLGLMVLVIEGCSAPNESNSGWQKVFQNDASGNSVFGDKARLMDAVRLGYPIRIGWGSNRVEHVADAHFLTIFDGEEVFAQTQTIIGQAPTIEGDTMKIRFRAQNHWTKMAGTNGYSSGLMTDYFNDSIAGGGVDRYTATTWYVLYPEHKLPIEARPLWKKDAPNWNTWKERQ